MTTDDKPKPDFSKPHDLTNLDGLCGVDREVYNLMPAYADIPEEFRRGRTPFHEVQARWFFGGLPRWPLQPKPGIDHTAALRHLSAIQRSWTPPHEHKAAGVAYLMSLWYEPPRGGEHKADARPDRAKAKPKGKATAKPTVEIGTPKRRTGPLKGGLGI
jgi:hypothetical protein